MSATQPGLFTHPTLIIQNAFGIPINTNNTGTVTQRLLPYIIVGFTIVLDALVEEYANGRSFTDDQAAIYRSVEERLGTNYGLDGKACLQRFICELTKNPVRDWTIFGELVTVVFSPRADGRLELEPYRDAQLAGEVGHPESCTISYGYFCPISVFNYFRTLEGPLAEGQEWQPPYYDPYDFNGYTGYMGYN